MFHLFLLVSKNDPLGKVLVHHVAPFFYLLFLFTAGAVLCD